jgi:fluoride exporter
MLKAIILVGTGGMLGSIGRYLTSVFVFRFFPSAFPLGTLAANMLGCFIIGIIFGASQRYDWPDENWRLFLATGICGGYTTFSSFAIENLRQLQEGHYGAFALYALVSFAGGLFFALAGMLAARI